MKQEPLHLNFTLFSQLYYFFPLQKQCYPWKSLLLARLVVIGWHKGFGLVNIQERDLSSVSATEGNKLDLSAFWLCIFLFKKETNKYDHNMKKRRREQKRKGEKCKLKSNLFCVFLLWLEEEEAFIDWSGRTDLERNLLRAPTTTMVCSPPENHSTDSQHNSQHTRALRTNYLLMRSTILCRRHEKDMWGELGIKKMICLPEVVYVCTQISSVTAGSLIDMNSTPSSYGHSHPALDRPLCFSSSCDQQDCVRATTCAELDFLT